MKASICTICNFRNIPECIFFMLFKGNGDAGRLECFVTSSLCMTELHCRLLDLLVIVQNAFSKSLLIFDLDETLIHQHFDDTHGKCLHHGIEHGTDSGSLCTRGRDAQGNEVDWSVTFLSKTNS